MPVALPERQMMPTDTDAGLLLLLLPLLLLLLLLLGPTSIDWKTRWIYCMHPCCAEHPHI
jgi:hypothetical protein